MNCVSTTLELKSQHTHSRIFQNDCQFVAHSSFIIFTKQNKSPTMAMLTKSNYKMCWCCWFCICCSDYTSCSCWLLLTSIYLGGNVKLPELLQLLFCCSLLQFVAVCCTLLLYCSGTSRALHSRLPSIKPPMRLLPIMSVVNRS